jgi:hypothetical protein
MQEFPANYGRSPADQERSAADIIGRAEATGAQRVSAKPAKRRLSVLSRFFKFCLDQGLISKALREELTEEHECQIAWKCEPFSRPITTRVAAC